MRSLAPLYLLAACAIVACGEEHLTRTVFDRDGHQRAEVSEVNSKKHGPYRVFDANGELRIAGWYAHDLHAGTWLKWHPSGKLASFGAYAQGLPDGLHATWYNNGRLQSIRSYRVGVPHGPVLLLLPDGRPELWSDFTDGERDGPHHHWYYDDDRFAGYLAAVFSMGRKQGRWFQTDRSGHLEWDADFDQDSLVTTRIDQRR